MPFNLKGGSPKKMKQGTYWVQRHIADQKREAARNRRIAVANAKAADFNERYSRIVRNSNSYHHGHKGDGLSMTLKQYEKFTEKMDEYNELKAWIDSNIEGAKISNLNKLSTLARSIITMCTKAREQAVHYDASEKRLTVAKKIMDFS